MNFEQFKQSNPIGTKVLCTVKNVQPFGVFTEVSKDIFGLIRIPELIIQNGIKSKYPEEYHQVGDEIEAYILWYDGGEKISLTQKPENHEKLLFERGSTKIK